MSLSPVFDLWGIQIGANLTWDSETQFAARSLNRYALNPRFAWGEVWLGEREQGGFAQSAAVKLVRPGMASELVESRFALERQVLEAGEKESVLPSLFRLRRSVRQVLRAARNQRESVQRLAVGTIRSLRQETCYQFRDVHDHLILLHDSLDRPRPERAPPQERNGARRAAEAATAGRVDGIEHANVAIRVPRVVQDVPPRGLLVLEQLAESGVDAGPVPGIGEHPLHAGGVAGRVAQGGNAAVVEA
jgi:hypothetical protein